MSYKSHTRGSTRVFDHLYDPLYRTSGVRDVWRANQIALSNSAPVHIVPVYQNMFTDLPRRPRNCYVAQQNPLPFYPNLSQSDSDSRTIKPHHLLADTVRGSNRVKYFSHPLTNTKTVNLQLNITNAGKDCRCLSREEELFKTKECQTIYRESSAQTKPWMPNAIIGEKRPDTPEIVYVADLIQGNGIPGINEVEIVEKARKRREWEKLLPPISSTNEWNKRRIILEVFEWEEWLAREDEIEACQKLRMKIVQKMVDNRKRVHRTKSEQIIENSAKRIEAEAEIKIQMMRIKHQRKLRRLDIEHDKTTKKYKPVSVAVEHIDQASNLYGPQARFGVHPKHKHFMAFKTHFEARLDGLHQMQTKCFNVDKFIQPKDDISKPKGPIKEIKQGLWSDKYLQYLYESLKTFSAIQTTQKREIPQCVEYIKEPSTATILTPPSIKNIYPEDYENAVVLKKHFKAGAMKNLTARNKLQQLVSELQQMNSNIGHHPNSSSDYKIKQYEKRRRDNLQRIKMQINEIIQKQQGTSMAFFLEFLEKEINRLTTEKKSHAIYLLAEKERIKREAEDAAKRDYDENIRFQQEEIYRNILQTDFNTSTKYLENILIDCFDKNVEIDAREQIRNVVQYINEQGYQTLAECVANEIVHETILPTILSKLEIYEIAKDETMNCIENAIDIVMPLTNDIDDEFIQMTNIVYGVIDQEINNTTKNVGESNADDLLVSARSDEENAQLSEILSDIKSRIIEYSEFDTTELSLSEKSFANSEDLVEN